MNALARTDEPNDTDDKLVAATPREITDALDFMFNNMLSPTGDKPESRMRGYIICLEGRPAWAIHEAIRRFIRGEVEDASPKFAPYPAELAKVVQHVIAPVYQERRKEQQSKAREVYTPVQRTPEELERHKARIVQLYREMGWARDDNDPDAFRANMEAKYGKEALDAIPDNPRRFDVHGFNGPKQ